MAASWFTPPSRKAHGLRSNPSRTRREQMQTREFRLRSGNVFDAFIRQHADGWCPLTDGTTSARSTRFAITLAGITPMPGRPRPSTCTSPAAASTSPHDCDGLGTSGWSGRKAGRTSRCRSVGG